MIQSTMAVQPTLVECCRERQRRQRVEIPFSASSRFLVRQMTRCFDVTRSTLAADFRITPLVENTPYFFDEPRSQQQHHNSRATSINLPRNMRVHHAYTFTTTDYCSFLGLFTYNDLARMYGYRSPRRNSFRVLAPSRPQPTPCQWRSTWHFGTVAARVKTRS
jgi:hypothetical protein